MYDLCTSTFLYLPGQSGALLASRAGMIAAEKSMDIACVYVLSSRDCFTVLYLVFKRNICVGQAGSQWRRKATMKSEQVCLVDRLTLVPGVGGFVISLLICPSGLFSSFSFWLNACLSVCLSYLRRYCSVHLRRNNFIS